MIVVLMHLLALGAFRHEILTHFLETAFQSLNAPFGARCFLTLKRSSPVEQADGSLNAPFGARCFPTCKAEQKSVDRNKKS